MPNTCIWLPHTHAAGKVLHLLYRKYMAYTLQPTSTMLAIGLLVSNAWIQLSSTIDDGSGGNGVGM